MNNKKLEGLTATWRNIARKLQDDKIRPELSNSETWLISNTMEQCAGELEALIFIEETFDKGSKT